MKGFENDADEKESLTIEQQNLLEDFLKNSKHYTVYNHVSEARKQLEIAKLDKSRNVH